MATKKKAARRAAIEIYEATIGRWYWRLRAPNGLITADGSEGYDSKANAKRAARKHIEHMTNAVIVEIAK